MPSTSADMGLEMTDVESQPELDLLPTFAAGWGMALHILYLFNFCSFPFISD